MSAKRVVLGGSLAAAISVAVVACLALGTVDGLEPIKAKIRKDFPTVESVTTDALAARLDPETSPERRPLLLDVRREEEYAVSRLPGARRIDPGAGAEALRDVAKDREIVVYCSVGYRSARLGERLQKAGFTRIRNLEGSIFEWAEKGYPLVQGERTVTKVHPYGRAWAWLVSEPLRAYTPEAALQ